MKNDNQLIFINEFGYITDSKIVLNRKNGTEEIIITNITGISFFHKKNFLNAMVMFSLGITSLLTSFSNRVGSSESLIIIIFGIFFLAIGALFLFGHFEIIISVAGVDRPSIKVSNFKKDQAVRFVSAINQIIK